MSEGYYIEKWGGGRYTVVAWFNTYEKANQELQWILVSGRWHGMKPRIVAE